MEFKGTKGKWKFVTTPDYHEPKCSRIEVVSVENFKSAWICKVQNNGIIGKTEGKANAKLISCAPEMLEMLQKCKEYFLIKTDLKSEERADAIGELIKKATTL